MEQLIDSCKVSPIEWKGDMMVCDRCGNSFPAGEHFDFVCRENTVLILCPNCTEYLSEYEEELDAYIQRVNTIEKKKECKNKHE